MKASLINMRLTSRYSTESYAFAVKGFCLLFSAFRIRSGTQFHGCTDLSTLCRDKSHTYLPSPKSFVCNLQDSGRHVTSVFQGLSLSLSLRRAGRREPWERGWLFRKGSKLAGCSIQISLQWPCANVFHKSFNSFTCWAPFMLEEVRNLKIIRKISILISRLWSLN